MNNKSGNIVLNLICLSIFSLMPYVSLAQSYMADSLITKGDSLHNIYRFEESIQAYDKALSVLPDSTVSIEDSIFRNSLNEKLTQSKNGQSLCSFVYKPTVIAKKMFSIEDFFLYYPLEDRSWRPVPSQLDSFPSAFSKAIYAPDSAKTIYFSALDEAGVRNIYQTEHADTIWTFPTLLNEQMTSVCDEIYPMLSNDGKHLFFASKGLYGVGGYDLYVSEWDEESRDWSVPVNMGFPYSSPSNDFLYINSPDGKYSLFASDRDCPEDSVWVYVTEYDNMPVRNSLQKPEELLELSQLKPSSSMEIMQSSGDVKSEIPENEDTRKYMEKMDEIRLIRDSIASYETLLRDSRKKYSIAETEEEKVRLTGKILGMESRIPVFQQRLEAATKELQQIEMNFLFSGVVIDPASLLNEAKREIVAETADYIFSKMLMGEPLNLEIEIPEEQFDYTFKVLDTAQIVQDVRIDKGVIYQIQFYTSTKKAPLEALKGLSPVFETVSSSGRHIYRVGMFSSYSDVISHLNTVKRLGFKGAYVVGYVDGTEKHISIVRSEENKRRESQKEFFRVNIYPYGGELDSVAMSAIRQQSSGKDLAKDDKGYYVAPIESKSRAAALVEFVEVMEYGEATIEKL